MTALVPTATIEVLMKYDVHRVTQLWGHIPAQQTDEPHCTKAHFPEMNLASQGQRKTWQGEESCALSIGHITRLLLLGDSSGMRAPTLLPEPQHCLSPATDLQSGLSESLSHPKADASETSQLLTTCKEATENPWEVRVLSEEDGANSPLGSHPQAWALFPSSSAPRGHPPARAK
ncbi:ras-related protein Rab-11A isoform X5 [Strix aluco]|uniref:ras-related protein Rab-11A isoform X5 n=1 Tax=Strix aluco TaxID=111821 RepID=UPI003DA33158